MCKVALRFVTYLKESGGREGGLDIDKNVVSKLLVCELLGFGPLINPLVFTQFPVPQLSIIPCDKYIRNYDIMCYIYEYCSTDCR